MLKKILRVLGLGKSQDAAATRTSTTAPGGHSSEDSSSSPAAAGSGKGRRKAADQSDDRRSRPAPADGEWRPGQPPADGEIAPVAADDRPPRRDRGPRPDRPERPRGPRNDGERRPRPEGEGERAPRPEGERPPRPEGDRPPRPERDRGPRQDRDRGPRRDNGPRRDGRGGSGGRGSKPRRDGPPSDRPPHHEEVYTPPIPLADLPEIDLATAGVEGFAALGLDETVLKGVARAGYNKPTTIQEQAIPVILSGKDVIGSSQTGSGKTAAFALPIISKLKGPGKMRCLILEPVRELAAQVEEQFVKYGAYAGLRPLLVHGGVGYGKQREGLQRGVDVLIATPGRLLDLMSQGAVGLDDVEVLVLDEVDRMLDMGFLPDVRRIVSRCPAARQTLFFSATVQSEIANLAAWALKDPFRIEIGRAGGAATTVSHYFYPVNRMQREDLLVALLKETKFHSVMVFTRTKADADLLAARVSREGNLNLAVMHSDIPQRQRSQSLTDFREGKVDVMIATDLAARGLDISNVTHVINYSVPENPEDYVHRIGRTGRAEKEGDAFTLLSADELQYAEGVERYINQKVERRKLEGFDYLYTTLLDDSAAAQAHLRANTGRGRSGFGKRKR